MFIFVRGIIIICLLMLLLYVFKCENSVMSNDIYIYIYIYIIYHLQVISTKQMSLDGMGYVTMKLFGS